MLRVIRGARIQKVLLKENDVVALLIKNNFSDCSVPVIPDGCTFLLYLLTHKCL